MNKSDQPREGEIILYTTPEGTARVEVFFQDETFWLSQRRMADLFGVEVPTINYHLKEIYKSGELQRSRNYSKNSNSSRGRQASGHPRGGFL